MISRIAIRRRTFLAGTAILALRALHWSALAQEARKVAKIGLLFLGSPDQDVSERARSFRDGMTALGWVEGRTVHYEYRFASGSPPKLAAHAVELAAAPVKFRMQNASSHSSGHGCRWPATITSTFHFCAYIAAEL